MTSDLRGMIASVGGSPEPVRNALDNIRPSLALFVVSEASRIEVEDKVLRGMDDVPQYRYLEISDHEDIGTCYQEIRKGIRSWISDTKLDPEEIYVDITGGTKVMSAVLLLAAVEQFKNFTYIGGSNRDSNNLGAVVTGSERVCRYQNPWTKYAVRELERANGLLEGFYADSATAILEDAAQKCDETIRTRLKAFAGLVKALGMADRFEFKEACNEFSRWRVHLELLLDYPIYKEFLILHKHWKDVRDQVKRSDQTAGLQTFLELIANADRRAKQERYDDAVGRLYRAIELRGQQLVKQSFGAELGKVPIECLPTDNWEDVFGNCKPPDNGFYKLGVRDLFQILKFCEDKAVGEHVPYLQLPQRSFAETEQFATCSRLVAH